MNQLIPTKLTILKLVNFNLIFPDFLEFVVLQVLEKLSYSLSAICWIMD